MKNHKSFQQQTTTIKPGKNHAKNQIWQIAITISSVTGLLSLTGLATLGYYAFVPPPRKQLSLGPNLTSLESPIGEQMLAQSKISQDYTPLKTYFETQERPAYCGVASAVIVLNALGKNESKFKRLNQQTFFNSITQSIRSPYLVTFLGMSLDDLAALIRSYKRQVQVDHASSTTLQQFRTQAIANLRNDQDFIIVNYDRSQIGQAGSGHISPLAAYDEKTDQFLILDVSSYKYPPVWISASTLWNAINTTDTISQKTRGYLIIKK